MNVITVSGAGCTGKTTILDTMKRILEEKYAGEKTVRTYSEFIRTLYEKEYKDKYPTFSDLLSGDPMDIIKLHKETARMFNDVLWSSETDDVLLFDRCPIDINIYLYMNVAEYLDNIWVRIEYRKAAAYISRCIKDFLNHNPTMFYTRPFSDEVEQDGFRPMSLINRRSLELSLFDKEFYSTPGVFVLPSKLEDRVVLLEEYFENY